MKLLLIGAPGSGKTYIAKKLSAELNLAHIESDQFFWSGQDLRIGVTEAIRQDRWILDGHVSKVHDLVFPLVDKIIIVEALNVKSLIRSLLRDWRHPSKAWYNFQNYEKLRGVRQKLIQDFAVGRPGDVIVLENFPDLSEGQFTAFCEDLKSTSVKSKKKTIKT